VLKFLLQRLAWSLVVLLGLSIIIFVIARVVPGDPARMALGPRAPEEVVQRLRNEMHLNEPLHIQYAYWIKGAVQGDFGRSLMTKRPVTMDLREFLPNTIELVLFAGILQALMGLLLGITGATHSERWPDIVIRVLGYIGVATPSFVFAVFLLLIFGYWWPLLPTIGGRISPGLQVHTLTGLLTLDSLLTGNFRAFYDTMAHMALPAIALAIGGMAQEARITRSSMLDNMGKDYVLMMRAQGVPRRLIMSRYLLKPSVIPTVSIMGLDFASLFGNAFLVELVFNWPGLSRYGIMSMLRKDLNATCAVVLVIGAVFIATNIVVDLVVSFLDPRIRLGAQKS
jgi:peptide/nickel transport system permease protein